MKKQNIHRLIVLFFYFFLCLQPAAAAPGGQAQSQGAPSTSAGEGESDQLMKTEASPEEDSDDKSDKPLAGALFRRRIVDPGKFPPKSPLPARIALAPFRALAPKVDRGLTLVEDTNLVERIQIILNNPYIRPLFGGLGDGFGFGGGVYLSSANRLSNNVNLFASAHLTSTEYMETTFGVRADPTGGAHRIFSADGVARYRLRPQEDFFGIGPQSSRSQRSNYDLDWLKALLSLGAYQQPWLKRKQEVRYKSVGNYSAAYFEPQKWKQNFPLVAFENMTDRDAFWAAMIVGSFTNEQIRAAVETGEISDPEAARYLAEQIIERRDRIVRYYLGRWAALDNFRVERAGEAFALLFDDLREEFFEEDEGAHKAMNMRSGR